MLCDFCNSEVVVINWGSTPIAGYKVDSLDVSLKQPEFPLDMMYCPRCNYTKYREYDGMAEILSKMYEEQETTYSISNTVSEYIDTLTSELIDTYSLSNVSTVLEIGCNDGSMLYSFKNKLNCTVIGVEPSRCFNKIWELRGLNVINEFFTLSTLEKINNKLDMIIIRHVLEHISDVKQILESISSIMNEHTTLIIEVPYLVTVLKDRRLDNISHPHISYFSVRSMNEVLSKFSLGIIEYKLVDTDGGSIVFHIKKGINTAERLLDTISESDFIELKDYLFERKHAVELALDKFKPDEVVGAGAGAKGPHLIYLFGLDRYISTVFDVQDAFVNKYLPKTGIIIRDEDYSDTRLKAVINLAPTHYAKIRARVPGHLEVINIIEERRN